MNTSFNYREAVPNKSVDDERASPNNALRPAYPLRGLLSGLRSSARLSDGAVQPGGQTPLWSAVSIYVFGEYDAKFGGRAANLLLGLQLGVPITLVAGLGYLLPVAIATRRVDALPRGATALAAVGAMSSMAILATGVIGEFSHGLPFGAVGSQVLAFAICGGVVGLVTVLIARWLLKGWLVPGPPQENS